MAQAIVEHAGSAPRGQESAFAYGILESVLRYFARRRTVRELSRLDDRMLADIGLSRSDIHMAAAGTADSPTQKKTPLWVEWLSRIQLAFTHAAMIRTLHRLPDHILNDIGVERGRIEETVYRVMAENATAAKAPRSETSRTSPVHGLLRRVETATWPSRRTQTNRTTSPETTTEPSAANRNQERADVA